MMFDGIQRIAFIQGKECARLGYERISQYRGTNAEYFWLAGYDGKPIEYGCLLWYQSF